MKREYRLFLVSYPELVLHVTNGESAASVIRAAGFPGDVLCWNDVLHEGPVPDVSEEDLRSVRARFLSDAAWTT